MWNADIVIEGDDQAQVDVRRALRHLRSCAPGHLAPTVAAPGRTGLARLGPVRWDTDVFVLPALAATAPAVARTIVDHRVRGLPAARRLAQHLGFTGARFPQESSDGGEDATPREVLDVTGRPIRMWAGLREEHITADVVWAAMTYVAWTGDHMFLRGPGSRLLAETAHYWAVRCTVDPDGSAHLREVMGPDSYHECVDDNAYTNNLVAWHLRTAARHGAAGMSERRRWATLADAMFTGYDEASGRHHQFVGFDVLDDVRMPDLATCPPVDAALVIGPARIGSTQIIKQPDVLLLHHMLPDSVPEGSLSRDLDHHLPRTAHGSSLSPAICAGLLARDGRPDGGLELLHLAGRMGRDDPTRSGAAGLHLAAMGGLWQAVVTGFAGVRPVEDRLDIVPQLPRSWHRLEIHLVHRGRKVVVDVGHDEIRVSADRPLAVRVNGHDRVTPTLLPVPHRTGSA